MENVPTRILAENANNLKIQAEGWFIQLLTVPDLEAVGQAFSRE
jgi:hypothetical protein